LGLESVKREENEWGNRGSESVAARRVREDCKERPLFKVISIILTHNHDYETRELTRPSLRFNSP